VVPGVIATRQCIVRPRAASHSSDGLSLGYPSRRVTQRPEATMKGSEKPKKLAKKVAQKTLKEKRADKRANK
jgi:hypothetical protein